MTRAFVVALLAGLAVVNAVSIADCAALQTGPNQSPIKGATVCGCAVGKQYFGSSRGCENCASIRFRCPEAEIYSSSGLYCGFGGFASPDHSFCVCEPGIGYAPGTGSCVIFLPKCYPGYYDLSGQCALCPSNATCVGGAQPPSNCTAGLVPDTNRTTCVTAVVPSPATPSPATGGGGAPGGGNAAPAACGAGTVPVSGASYCADDETESDIIIPYAISSPQLCTGGDIVKGLLAGPTPVTLAMRATFALALGYEMTETFIEALTVCDNTRIAVERGSSVNSETPNATYVAIAQAGLSPPRNGSRLLSVQSSDGVTVSVMAPRIVSSAMRNLQSRDAISVAIDGQTIVFELGVSVPSVLAAPLAAFLQSTMDGSSTATIKAKADALSTAIATSSVSVSLPTSLASLVQNATVAGVVPSAFKTGMINVTTTSTLFLGLPAGSVRSKPVTAAIRTGQPKINAPGSPVAQSNAALGALVLIPLGIMLAIFIYFRHKRLEEKTFAGKTVTTPGDGSSATTSHDPVSDVDSVVPVIGVGTSTEFTKTSNPLGGAEASAALTLRTEARAN